MGPRIIGAGSIHTQHTEHTDLSRSGGVAAGCHRFDVDVAVLVLVQHQTQRPVQFDDVVVGLRGPRSLGPPQEVVVVVRVLAHGERRRRRTRRTCRRRRRLSLLRRGSTSCRLKRRTGTGRQQQHGGSGKGDLTKHTRSGRDHRNKKKKAVVVAVGSWMVL